VTAAVAALDPASRMTAPACGALAVSRATVHRHRTRLAAPAAIPKPRPRSARGLSDAQLRVVLDLLHAPRFADQAPAEIYAALLDEGVYRCSIRTMYRILDANAEVRERRAQLRHPTYSKPELLAEGPNQVWSWDITKLTSVSLAPAKLAKREEGTNQMELFLPLRDHRHLQPPGRRLVRGGR
jgi:putative transposase